MFNQKWTLRQGPDWFSLFQGSFGRVNCFLWFPASLLILQVSWRSAGAAVDKTLSRCLIDKDLTDWQSKYSDEKGECSLNGHFIKEIQKKSNCKLKAESKTA